MTFPPVVLLNGVLVEESQASVSLWDRGFLYGDSVFEVLRTYHRRVFAAEEHLARLQFGLRRMGIVLPVPARVLTAELDLAVQQSSAPECHVRLIVSRGIADPGVLPTNPGKATRVVIASPLVEPNTQLYEKGIRAITLSSPKENGPLSLAGFKSGNYSRHVQALRVAREAQAQEAILRTEAGELIEAATANIFLVEQNTLRTPSLESGALPGITRKIVLSLADRVGLRAVEEKLELSDLWSAEEVFLTSSIREIVPVVEIDEHVVGDGLPGAKTRALINAFRTFTRGSQTRG